MSAKHCPHCGGCPHGPEPTWIALVRLWTIGATVGASVSVVMSLLRWWLT